MKQLLTWGTYAVLVVLFLGPGSLRAHEGHEKTALSPESSQVQEAPEAGGALRTSPPSTPEQPDLFRSLTEHVHNKLVHFPIALGLVAVLFVWLALRWPGLETSAEILVWLAALAAVPTVIAGLLQAGPFQDTPKEIWMNRHRLLGLATAGALFLWGGLFRLGISSRWIRLWGLVVALLISLTGSLGGLLSHG